MQEKHHIDHPSWRIWAETTPEAKFIFPRAHKRAVANDGIADRNAVGLNAGDTVRIGNMTYQEAADLAGDVRPKMVIPGHWDMFADNSEDPELFKKYIEAKYKDGLVCRIPKVLEKMFISLVCLKDYSTLKMWRMKL